MIGEGSKTGPDGRGGNGEAKLPVAITRRNAKKPAVRYCLLIIALV